MKNLSSRKFNHFGIFLLLFLTCAAFSVAEAQEPVSSPTAEGCVSGNCVNGRGKYIYANGDVYEGDYINGKKEGQGKYTYKTGAVYIGQFTNNGRTGRGTYNFKNGDQYIGEFYQGRLNGSGIYYFKTNNTKKEGLWKDNVFVSADTQNAKKADNEPEDEFDKIAREEGIVISKEEKAKNKKDAKEMADELIKNPGQYDKLLEVKEIRKEFYEMTQLRFRQQAISKKFSEFDAAYREPLSDQQRLEMLNQIIPEYQNALKETEALEKPTFNFSVEEKSKIAENKTYYTKVLSILNGMKAAMQPAVAQTGGFSQAEVDEFNKQNPNVGKEKLQTEEGKVTDSETQNKSLKLYLERGMTYFKSGKFDEALADGNEALKINPTSASALLLRGLAKGGKKDYEGAIADFSQIIKISPTRASGGYFQRGRIYEQKGDYSKALADYGKAVELDPKAAEAATKARLRTEAKMNAAQSGTSVGGALTEMTNAIEAKNAELRKLKQYQEKFNALQKEVDPLLAKLQATPADDRENQRAIRAALLPKVQAVRNYLADSIVELMEYKSAEGQKLRETFIGVFKSVNDAIAKLY